MIPAPASVARPRSPRSMSKVLAPAHTRGYAVDMPTMPPPTTIASYIRDPEVGRYLSCLRTEGKGEAVGCDTVPLLPLVCYPPCAPTCDARVTVVSAVATATEPYSGQRRFHVSTKP